MPLAAVRLRLGISFECLDEIAGLTRGHSCKILSERSKGLGELSFNLLVGAMGLEIVIRHDLAACEKIAARWQRRNESQVRDHAARGTPFARHATSGAPEKTALPA